MRRSNHYEAAFEGFIRSIRVPCVAIDEAKRAVYGEDGLKNPDFLLYPQFGSNLVVEVKGKRAKNARGRRDWENWVTTDDLDGLVRWQAMFGPGFRAVLAFAYAEPIGRSRCPARMERTSSEGSITGSGRWAWTITSRTCDRADRRGRRWPWPAARSGGGCALYSNGCR